MIIIQDTGVMEGNAEERILSSIDDAVFVDDTLGVFRFTHGEGG